MGKRYLALWIGLMLVLSACDREDGPGALDTGTPDDTPHEPTEDLDRSDGADLDSLRFPDELIFGVASSAHQIEGGNTNNNWYQFETLERYAGQTAEPSGQAANGYELWETDNGLVEDTHLDAYRFSIEWSRVMPQLGVFDEAEIAHYRAILEDLRERGIRPFVALHHFTDPIWLNDLRDPTCSNGPSDGNLCGWTNPDAVDAFVAFSERMAREFGALVDDWCTFNEPNTYTHVGYLAQLFPPGHPGTPAPDLPDDSRWLDVVAPVARALVEAHVRAYEAIRTADLMDADDDGQAAVVGWTIAVQYIAPVDPGAPDHEAAAQHYRMFFNTLYPDAVATGGWDPDFDDQPDERHPEWTGRQDYIGIQYYSRVFVFPLPGAGEIISVVPCQSIFADLFPQCPEIDPLNRSFVNEVYPEGLYEVVSQFAERFPGIPLPITENGAAANNGERKAQILVRHLEQVHRLLDDGFSVPAYYYWSLTDNFEWADGFEPRFGLYHVDYDTFERRPTRAQAVLSEVAETHILSGSLRSELGVGRLLEDR